MDTQTLNSVRQSIQLEISSQSKNLIKRNEYVAIAALINSIMLKVEEERELLKDCSHIATLTNNNMLVKSIEELINKLYLEYGALDGIRRSIEILVAR